MINDFISIAIPAYKASFLKEAINSVLNQTYKNFELIIVNDNSPENIDLIINSFNDKRIQYYKNKKNLGKESIVLNWNKCLEYANGAFFVLLCDDDIMHPTFIETMLKISYKYPKCNVFRARTQYIDNNTKKIIYHTKEWPENECFIDFLKAQLSNDRKHTISEFMYRTAHIKKQGGYVVFPVGYYSDIASILYLIQNNNIVSIGGAPLLTFRKSLINISSNTSYNKEKVKAAITYYQWLQSFLMSNENVTINFKEKCEYDIYHYFITTTNIYNAISILNCIPIKIWDKKTKLIHFINWIKVHIFPKRILKQ